MMGTYRGKDEGGRMKDENKREGKDANVHNDIHEL